MVQLSVLLGFFSSSELQGWGGEQRRMEGAVTVLFVSEQKINSAAVEG